MPLRVDCNCNVFVTCSDGTEKQNLTSDQVKALINSSATNGAPQPQPGGGCQVYPVTISGGQLQIIPTQVSTGDTIKLTSAIGASTQDGVGWQCPDGSIYFAGACAGGGVTNAGAYLPTVKIGKVILYLDGVYYDLTLGTAFTVPSGVANKTPMLVLNYVSSNPISGNIDCQVQVCNNAAGTWSSTWDFTLSPGLFVAQFPGALGEPVWNAGSGWFIQANATGSVFNGQLQLVHDSANIRHVQWFYTPTGYTAPAGNAAFYNPAETTLISPLVTPSGTNGLYDDPVGVTSTEIGWYQGGGGGAGSVLFTKLVVSGTGTKPSQFP